MKDNSMMTVVGEEPDQINNSLLRQKNVWQNFENSFYLIIAAGGTYLRLWCIRLQLIENYKKLFRGDCPLEPITSAALTAHC